VPIEDGDAVRLVRFENGATDAIGVLEGSEVVDLSSSVASPRDGVASLLSGPSRNHVLNALADAPRRPLSEVRLLNPLPAPRIVFAIGLNYADHAAESGQSVPDFPVVFNKQVNCVTGPFDPIHYPRDGSMLDYEGELAFVIGRRCRHVPAGRGLDYIGGYTVMNDVSERDWQFRSPTWTMGKSFDTHGPLGPCVVTPDDIGDPHELELTTWVNGERRQHSNTNQLIFDCGRLVEILSTVCTLQPGDIVSTGTPAGVGMGMDPPGFLAVGDVVRIEIEGIGAIENTVIAEPAETVVG
jgi:2-keto-4-pentenoate hydratase/2-oxohepta-3-ene-1,7-dioic acid hydratase in catechol pathway